MAYEDFTGKLDAPAGGYIEFDGVLDEPEAAVVPKRREVPDATVGSVARDIASGALQIGPTAVKGMADIARLATGDRVGKDTSEAMERGMAAIRDTVGSERAAAQRENFQRDMVDDEVSIGQALMRNKGALADQILPTVGSMFLPVGAAGAAGKIAAASKAAKALDTATLAARVTAAQQAAGIGTIAAQNAADTFAELVDRGVPMEKAYIAAGITVPFSVVAGKLTGGAAEVAAARALTGMGAANVGARQVAKAAGKEGAQEMGEELGQIAGEAVGTGKMPSAVGAGKQLAVAGVLGAAMGGGVDVATGVAARSGGEGKGDGGARDLTVDVTYQDADGKTVTDVATTGAGQVSAAAAPAAEQSAVQAAQSGDTPSSAMDEITRLEAAQDAQQQERGALAQQVEQNAAGEALQEQVGESPAQAAQVEPAEPVEPVFDPDAVQAKTWPQFVLERGEKVSTLRKGTPIWDQLQQEWAAVKTRRAGTDPEGTGAAGAPAMEIQNRDRSRPASVVQMQAMAQSPDYLRLGVSRSPESGAPMVFAVGDQADAVHALGNADVAVMSDGQRVPFRYAVMEAADVQPSNFADGAVNPLFDAAHPGTVKALNNGRTAGLRAAYERGTAGAYRQELAADSAMHGIDPAVIEGMQAPVLVRLYSERDNQANMGAKSQGQALGLSAAEQAATDAALVDAGVLEVFDSGALDSAANRDFARAFIGKLQEHGQDVAGMMDANGALSPAGVTRLQAALVHKAYGDGDLVESLFGSTDNDIRAIGEALKAVAGEWANMRLAAERGAINGQTDVTENLLQAIRLVQKARRERAALYDAVQQVDMLTGDVPDALTVGLLRLLYSGEYLTRPTGRERLVESLRVYMGSALATSPSGDMFGEQVGPADILAALSAASGGQPSTQQQQNNGTSTDTQQTAAPQGGREPAGSDTAGGRADAAGAEARGPEPDGAGQAAAEDRGGRQGQAAQAAQRQPDQQGAEGLGQDRVGEVALRGDELGPGLSGRALRDAAKEFARSRLADTTAHNLATDQEISLPWQGLKHAISNANDPELRLIPALPELLRAARLQESLPDKADRPDIVAAHRFVVKARLGDEVLDVGIVVREHRDGHRFYDHFIIGNKNPTGISEAATGENQQLGDQPAVGSATILPTDTPAFKRWFGNSKVVDAEGKPLVMYHGTSASEEGDAFTSFDVYASNYGLMGMGGYFTADPEVASSYTSKGRGETPTVYPVYLSIKNPLDMDAKTDATQWKQQFPDAEAWHEGGDTNESWYRAAEDGLRDEMVPKWEGAERLQDGIRAMGFDGITHVGGGRVQSDGVRHRVFIAFDPEQIKSATGNNGDFDPSRPDIRFRRGENSVAPEMTADLAQELLRIAGGTAPAGERRMQPVAMTRVQKVADEVRKAWANAPRINVVFDLQDPRVPQEARDAEQLQAAEGADGVPKGFYFDGEVYLLASQLETPQDAARVLYHEALGHHGLRGAFGEKLDAVLDQIIVARPHEVQAKLQEYGELDDAAGRRYAAEEVLAEMAEKHPELGFVRRAVAAIRAWLRANVPAFRGLALSDAEIIRDFILPARRWVERSNAGSVAAHGSRPAFSLDSDAGRRALQELAKLDDLFTFPKSQQTELAAIAREHDPEIRVSKPVSIAGRQEYILTMRDGKKATLSVRKPNPYGEQVYDMRYTDDGMEAVTGRPGENPEDVPPTTDVWLDVSKLTQGDSGAMAYSIASTFAHNTGSIFIGDPHGLSKTALRRRLEQMISSALKFGTTRHLAPHPDQVRGGHGVPGLRWVYGDDVGNVERMIAASLGAMDNAFPTSNQIEYDAERGSFRLSHSGQQLSRQQLAGLVGQSIERRRRVDGSAQGNAEAGWRTVARAAVWRALLREESGRDEGNRRKRGSLLGELAERHAQVLTDSNLKRRVFYSRGPTSVTTPKNSRSENPGDVSSWEQAQLSALQANTDRFIYEAQDGRIDLKRTQEAIQQSGREIDERFDARLAETLLPGRVAYRSQTFLEREVLPLTRMLARMKVSQTELGDYLHARAAPERNAQIAKVNPEMPDGGAGSNSQGLLLTTAAAQKYISDIPAGRRRQLEELAAKVDAITKGTRELLVAEGLEKAETIAAWESAYKHYVPMFREDIEAGGGSGVGAAASKRATGSEREAVNILANILLQREVAIGQAESNRFKVALYGLALSHPNPDFWATIRPASQAEQIAQDLDRMGVDPAIAEAGMRGVPTVRTVDPVTNQVVDRVNPMYKSLPGAMTLKVNGEVRVLLFNEKNERAMRMASALKGEDGLTNFDLASTIVGKTTRWLAAVNTQYNLAFGVVNFVRDTLGGAINLSSTALRGSSMRLLGQVPEAIGGISRALQGKQGSDWSKLYMQFQADGGQTGFREMFKRSSDRAAEVERQLAILEKQGRLTPMNALRATGKLLDGINTVLENAVRLSAYKLALDRGISRPEAARLARELTVDFNRKGRLGRELGPLYAFLNASLQGTERTIRALRGPEGARIIAGGLALGVAQALWLAMAGFDDDDLQEFTKARALIIPTSFEGKKYLAIPLPLGLHVLPNTGRVLTELVIGDHRDAGKKVFDAVGEIAGAVNPLGGGNVFTMDGALRTVAPTIADPLIELGFNKNFAGSQIEKESVGGDKDARPGYSRARESTLRSTTGQVYLGISKALNWLGGGSEHEAGLISPTPERVRYIAQTAGGGVLRELEKIINVSTAAARGEEVKASQIPLASRFGGSVDEDRVAQSRYFENVRRLERAENTLNAAKKAGDGDFIAQLVKERPEIALVSLGNRVQTEVAKLNKLAVSTVDDRETLQQIDQARLARMRALNEAVRELELAQRGPTIAQRIRRVSP